MSKLNNRIYFSVSSLLALIAAIFGIFAWQTISHKSSINPEAFNGTLLSKPREVQSFTLSGTDNSPFTNANLKNKWTIMFFGFTSCGYLCPNTMNEVGKMYRILQKQHVTSMPNVVMVTIDPKRDDLKKLKNYVQAFDNHFMGARGNNKVVKSLTKELGVAYERVKLPNTGNKNKDNYDIQHSGTLLLFNPDGKLTAFFTVPHDAKKLAADYRMLLVS